MPEIILYRSSELGKCIKRQAAVRMGYTAMAPPEKMQKVFDSGTATEEVAVAAMLELGMEVINRQLEVVLSVSEQIKVVGHIDGQQITSAAADPVVEVKSLSPTEYDKVPHNHDIWEAYDLAADYKWQISSYMLALNAPAEVVWVKRDSDPLDFFVTTLEVPFYSEVEIRARVLQIEAIARSGVLPETCDKRSYPCPVHYLHTDEKVEVNEKVEALAQSYLAADDALAQAKVNHSRLRNELKDAMGNEPGKCDGELIKVTTFIQKGRKQLNTNAMAADGIDLEKYYITGDEFLNMRVTRKKDE